MAAADDLSSATTLLVLLALLLSLVALSSLVSSYTSAYIAAPHEITTFIDAVDLSIHENESYDHDVSALQRLDDKIRLSGLLREIQRTGDDLREAISGLMAPGSETKMRTSTRLLWLNKRQGLRELTSRLDMLRMRFLVAYLGIIATVTRVEQESALKEKEREKEKQKEEKQSRGREPEKMGLNETFRRPALPHALTEELRRKPPPLRRITTQAIGHNDTTNSQPQHRMGWAGVVKELQSSPLMHKRHASIEGAMRSPRSPTLSP